MSDIWKIIAFMVLIAVAIFMGDARFLSLGGIAPGLAFLLFLLFFFRTDIGRRLGHPTAIFLVAVFVALSAVAVRSYLPSAVILAAVILAVHFFGRNITGDALLDMMIALLLGTAVFYGLSALILAHRFMPLTVGADILLTGALGLILWWPVGRLGSLHR